MALCFSRSSKTARSSNLGLFIEEGERSSSPSTKLSTASAPLAESLRLRFLCLCLCLCLRSLSSGDGCLCFLCLLRCLCFFLLCLASCFPTKSFPSPVKSSPVQSPLSSFPLLSELSGSSPLKIKYWPINVMYWSYLTNTISRITWNVKVIIIISIYSATVSDTSSVIDKTGVIGCSTGT